MCVCEARLPRHMKSLTSPHTLLHTHTSHRVSTYTNQRRTHYCVVTAHDTQARKTLITPGAASALTQAAKNSPNVCLQRNFCMPLIPSQTVIISNKRLLTVTYTAREYRVQSTSGWYFQKQGLCLYKSLLGRDIK